MKKSTDRGSFLIQILDRQHDSWQGTVTRLADNERRSVCSVLELVNMLADSILGGTTDGEVRPP